MRSASVLAVSQFQTIFLAATTSCFFCLKYDTSRSWNMRQSFSVCFATRARPSVKVTIPIFMRLLRSVRGLCLAFPRP